MGRQARYIEFLIVLCQCNGLAIRVNQWRICQLLLSEASELLPSLSVAPAASKKAAPKVIISGDATYFPFIKGGSMDLVEWLQQEHKGSSNDQKGPVGYFESCLGLFAALVEGRNLRNGPALRERLPYDLLATMLTDERLRSVKTRPDGRAVGLGICARVASIIRALYVDAEPHQLMARVKPVRIWQNVPVAAESGALSSRLTTKLAICWKQFDPLKAFLAKHIAKFHRMDATMIGENRVVLELLRLLLSLMRLGFYFSSELVPLLPNLLKLLDGRGDTIGPQDVGTSGKRYIKKTTIHVDTVVIMDCKVEVCRILQLLCTVRLGLRLSQLLDRYCDEFEQGLWDPEAEESTSPSKRPGSPKKGFGPKALVAKALGGGGGDVDGPYSRLEDLEEGSVAMEGSQSMSPTKLGKRGMSKSGGIVNMFRSRSRSRSIAFEKLFELLSFGNTETLVSVLMDLTFYEHPALVSSSLALLVRQFEQRRVLHDTTLRVQLLVKERMVATYSTFDELLRRLSLLASRRKLFDDELFETACILGELTIAVDTPCP